MVFFLWRCPLLVYYRNCRTERFAGETTTVSDRYTSSSELDHEKSHSKSSPILQVSRRQNAPPDYKAPVPDIENVEYEDPDKVMGSTVRGGLTRNVAYEIRAPGAWIRDRVVGTKGVYSYS